MSDDRPSIAARTATSPPGWRDALPAALIGAFWARCCVALGFAVAHLLSGSVRLPDGRLHLREGLLTWDGTYYRVLVQGGYPGAPPEAARFFPLYPTLARGLAPLVGGRVDVALLLVANLAAIAAAVVLWKLICEVLHSAEVADRTAWMIALWPAAFVLTFAYAEGLFILAVTGTLLMLHRRRFATAGLIALIASLVRPVGILLLIPAAIEVVSSWRSIAADDDPRDPPTLLGSAAVLLGPVVGLVVAMNWIARASGGSWSAPLSMQRTLRGGFREPVSRLLAGVVDLAGGNFRDLPNVGAAILAIALVVVAIRRRQPWSWVAYALATLLIGLSANNIDSLGRYLLPAVPLIAAAAQWADRPRRAQCIAVASSVCLVGATAAALLGHVVP